MKLLDPLVPLNLSESKIHGLNLVILNRAASRENRKVIPAGVLRVKVSRMERKIGARG